MARKKSGVNIPRPLALSRGRADGLMASAGRGSPAIGRPFSGVDGRVIAGMAFHEGLKRRPITVVTNL